MDLSSLVIATNSNDIKKVQWAGNIEEKKTKTSFVLGTKPSPLPDASQALINERPRRLNATKRPENHNPFALITTPASAAPSHWPVHCRPAF